MNRSPTLSCPEVAELAPEMGLDVLDGTTRAAVLAHLDGCAPCQALVDDMASVGDFLLTLAPPIDPPPGFQHRLLAATQPSPAPLRARRPRRTALAVAAVAAVVVAAVGIGVNVGGPSHTSGFRVSSPGAVAALGGTQLTAAALTHAGRHTGQVFLYRGRPSWLFMTVDVDGPPQQLTCQLQTTGGATTTLGAFTVSDGYRSWGSTLNNIDPGDIHAVRLLDAGGHTVADATVG